MHAAFSRSDTNASQLLNDEITYGRKFFGINKLGFFEVGSHHFSIAKICSDDLRFWLKKQVTSYCQKIATGPAA